jgi:phosphoribosylformylglycinamidine synthase subunit PurQ / glutaminase
VKREEIRVCVLRVAGTNCDSETRRSFEALGVRAEVAHVNDVVKKGNLLEYSALVFPGGFAYGDYVRAGAIWAKWVLVKLGRELKTFADEGRPVLGICNGFQVLVEAGLLPGFEGMSPIPEATLATNFPPGYNCRWISLKHENLGKCVFTWKIPKGKVLRVPVAHAEGRFLFPKEKEERYVKRLCENDQLVFRYCSEEGEYAGEEFPVNPNGSYYDIAGICNPEGTVFGLMPHPERAFYWWQQPDWTRWERTAEYGDGKLIFESLIGHLEKV